MKVLAINCGSSSLKFLVIEYRSFDNYQELSRGTVKGIGSEADFDFRICDGVTLSGKRFFQDHKEAVNYVVEWLSTADVSRTSILHDLTAVGHRVVHGGSRFSSPVFIDDEIILEIEALTDLAPLHNPASIMGVQAARSILGESFPMVAVFDTAFYHDLPEYASTYAIPYELSLRHRIKRYGFHGTAHRFLALRYEAIASRPMEQSKIITFHLGNGCSATAIRNGKPVDTSMGFTPLEGLVMGTRSGDIDPTILSYLASKEGLSLKEIEALLNEKSGLLGISGYSNDMKKLLEYAQSSQEKRVRLALDVFCYRVRKYMGAYLAVLGGADAVVFSGGIGENSPSVRSMICERMDWCGLKLDEDLNTAVVGREGQISSADAAIRTYVIPVDEELLIALDTANLLFRNWSLIGGENMLVDIG